MSIATLLAAIYVFLPVVVPGENVFQIFSINDRGQTMLNTDLSSGTFFRGTYTRLPPPPAGFQLTAFGINNDGVIVGSASPDSGGEQGFILRGTTYTIFSRPSWDNIEPRAISNSGLITGFSFSNDFRSRAGFVFDPETNTFTDATPPGSSLVIVQGMNAAGRITGSASQVGVGRYAFLWQHAPLERRGQLLVPFLDRVSVALGDARGSNGSSGRGINDAGIITGFTISSTAHAVGFVGSASRGYQFLSPPGATEDSDVVCEGINNHDQVVCAVTDASGNTQAFIGTPRDQDDDDDDDHGGG
jgi:hypothetical protein